MDKDQPKATVKVQTNAYPACIKPAEALIPYIAQFDIGSASCAVFCINSWSANRSFQNSAYALNAAILSIDHFGIKKAHQLQIIFRIFLRHSKHPPHIPL